MPVRVVTLDDLASDILRREPLGGTRIVGIDGPSGSGKSTLARRLANRVTAEIVQIDDFLSWGDLDSWWPRFEAEVITPLLNGDDVTYRVRDWIGDEFGDGLDGWKTVTWSPTVLIEGLTSTRAAIATRLAYRIWVDAPESVRLERGVQRDGEMHRGLWINMVGLEEAFFASDDTSARADLRVDGAPRLRHNPASQVVVIG